MDLLLLFSNFINWTLIDSLGAVSLYYLYIHQLSKLFETCKKLLKIKRMVFRI